MHTGGNGSTDQSVQRNAKGKKKKKSLKKSSSDVDQKSQATHPKGSGDAESAGRSCLCCRKRLPTVIAADTCDYLVLLTLCIPSVL